MIKKTLHNHMSYNIFAMAYFPINMGWETDEIVENPLSRRTKEALSWKRKVKMADAASQFSWREAHELLEGVEEKISREGYWNCILKSMTNWTGIQWACIRQSCERNFCMITGPWHKARFQTSTTWNGKKAASKSKGSYALCRV